MGIAERRERQRTELRETILAAARRILLEEGPAALTMRRLADAIEYSPGTIYLYFANREEIALHLVRDGFEQLVARLGPAAARCPDPVERLRAMATAYLEFALTDPETYRLIFMEKPAYAAAALAPDGDGSSEPGDRAFAFAASTIAQGVAAGTFRALDPDKAAEAFWCAIHGAISLHIACPQAVPDIRSTLGLTVELLLDGLRARPA